MVRQWIRSTYRRVWALPRLRRTYGALSLAETFQRIYRFKSWGDDGSPFSSGNGSRGPAAQQYCDVLIGFIRRHQVGSVLDLGCGDFAVGRVLCDATGIAYTGIDIVPELIEYHQRTVHDAQIRFLCADITRDPLPRADLCLVRQVFQHLSNEEIQRALGNLRGCPHLIIAEDVPVRPRSWNRDKQHGPDIRAYYGSGVWIDRPPFNVPISEAWEIPLTESSVLRTVLVADPADLKGDLAAVGRSAE